MDPARTRTWFVAAVALWSCGCLAPVISPVQPMTALSAEAGSKEMAGALGYAPAPGGGLGDSVVPGAPYADGELRFQIASRVQLSGGIGLSFQRYFLPWPGSAALGVKLTALEDDDFSVALAPRVVGASAFNLASSGTQNTIFGTRSAGGELPLLVSHRFSGGQVLTGQVWGRYFTERQEDSTTSGSSSSSTSNDPPVVSTGDTWGAGAAVLFAFPKVRRSPASFHVFFGAERLWLTQTSSSKNADAVVDPLVSVSRWSLLAGIGQTLPF